MKKQVLVFILLAILVVSCLALTACHSCGFGEWTVTKQATCTQDGSKERVCECGEKETEVIPATGHSYTPVVTSPNCTEEGYTTHTCSVCDDSYIDTHVDALGHDEISHTAKEPTCTEIGWDAYITCSRCDYTTYQEIPANGHNYNAVATAPNCTEKGFTIHTCSVCDDTYKDAYIEATGHDFKESDTCKFCAINIVDVAVEIYNMSENDSDGVKCYVISRPDGKHDAYIKGAGPMKNYSFDSPFWGSSFYIVNAYIGNGVTSIGDYAFDECARLTTVTFQEGSQLTNIGDSAFAHCSSLKNIIIPEGVISIDSNAFSDCTGLTSIAIPETLINVGNSAFDNCYSLTNITIPRSVIVIGEYAFSGCSSLTTVTFQDPNSWYVFKASDTTDVTSLALTDPAQNATYFKDTYCNYYWYKSNQ